MSGDSGAAVPIIGVLAVLGAGIGSVAGKYFDHPWVGAAIGAVAFPAAILVYSTNVPPTGSQAPQTAGTGRAPQIPQLV